MKRALTTIVGAFALAMAAQIALAADIPAKAPAYKAPVAAALFNWAGPYAGLHCGGAWGKTTTRNVDVEDPADRFEVRLKPSGGFCGGQAGYNWQHANFVAGVEGDLGYLWLKDRIAASDIEDPEEVEIREVKYGWYGTLTARLGSVWDRSLFYLKGGAAIARITNTAFTLDEGAVDDFSKISKTKVGWALGGGIEHAMSNPHWTWKIEYLYMDFGTQRAIGGDEQYTHKNRVHTVKLGVNYRFATVKAPGPVVTRY